MSTGLVGRDLVLGRRASWAVHGIGAWVYGWWVVLFGGGTSYCGIGATGGDLAMTTYNRQPARQRGVEVV